MSWSYAYAFRPGEGHERCDDVCVCETLGDTIIMAVADGAGSAEKAHAGSSLACQVFVEMAIPLYAGTLEPSCLLAAIRERVPEGEAEAYSCTLVGAVAGPKGAFFIQVGDGACVYRSNSTDEFQIAIWPEETEFLNQTYFVTMADAEDHMQVHRVDHPVSELALFTDGLQHLVLDLKTKAPHQPFFESVFKRLSDVPEHDLKASWWLERTLGSDPVTKRTDDDTSIVVARRISC